MNDSYVLNLLIKCTRVTSKFGWMGKVEGLDVGHDEFDVRYLIKTPRKQCRIDPQEGVKLPICGVQVEPLGVLMGAKQTQGLIS